MAPQEQALAKLKAQVQQAQRRISLQRFIVALGWSLFVTFLLAVTAIAIPKFWLFELASAAWFWSWLGGSFSIGLGAAAIWTYWTQSDALHVAIEVDQRFHLRERVSSTLSLDESGRAEETGRALLQDAIQRLDRIDVSSEFPIQVGWKNLLPLAPAMVACLLILLPSSQLEEHLQAAQTKRSNQKTIRESTTNLRKQAWQKKQKAEQLGLADTKDTFDKLTKGLDELQTSNRGNRRNALRKLSDLSAELQKRRDMLGSAEEVKKQFSQLKNLKSGPADQFANAIKSGNYSKAIDALKNLQQQLQQGKIHSDKQQSMAEQLNQMAEKFQHMGIAHQEAKKQLQQQIHQAQQRGNQNDIEKLQQNLDQINLQNEQMNQMQQMAKKLSQCAKCLKQGQAAGQNSNQTNQQAAMSQLNELTQNLQQLELADRELEILDEALDQIAMTKSSMSCQQCNGAGCAACNRDMQNGTPGSGLNKGRGQGERPEEETNTGFYDTKVKTNPSRGQAVVVGQVRGSNTAGDAQLEIQEEMDQFSQSTGDPLTGKRLPKAQRDHVQEYLKALKSE